jgi:hypothetical protein
MKIEIEVTEAELKDALARHVRAAVADRVNAWGANQAIKTIVDAMYKDTVALIVAETMKDSPTIRAHVLEAIKAKIKGQLTRMMKEPK